MQRLVACHGLVGLGASLILVVLPVDPYTAQAQFGLNPYGSVATSSPGSKFPNVDRQALAAFQAAEQALAQKKYGAAFQAADRLLSGTEDAFFKEAGEDRVYRSLKAAVAGMLRGMPADGRQLYESEFGPQARQRLETALEEGDVRQLETVSRRWFLTLAGAEATYHLGLRAWDRHQPFEAALWFERLREHPETAARREPLLSVQLAICWLRLGEYQEAERALERLQAAHPQAQITLGGKPVKLFGGDTFPLAKLQQIIHGGGSLSGPDRHRQLTRQNWPLVGGNPAGTAVSVGQAPALQPRWQLSVDPHDTAEYSSATTEEPVATASRPLPLPAASPLVVEGMILWRDAEKLVATDHATGRIRWWITPSNDGLMQVVAAQAQHTGGAMRDVWPVTGLLSSAGGSVYSLEAAESTPFASNGGNGGSRAYNRLMAHEVDSGKFLWEAGGDPNSELPASGVYFLGPPLPVAGSLFAIAESGEELQLIVLDAGTGRLEWKQVLALIDGNRVPQRHYRLWGASPSCHNGILVCPVGVGSLVAVDLASRSLCWGYEYDRQLPASGPGIQDGWQEVRARIAGDSVVVSAFDSAALTCFDLQTGKLRWTAPRGDGQFVAAVSEDRVIVAGSRTIRSYRTADGDEQWVCPLVSPPAGSGYVTDEVCYLPLASGEVVGINVDSGEIATRISGPAGLTLGNLVAVDSGIISLGRHRLQLFEDIERAGKRVEQSLALRPDDAATLAIRGELAAMQGRWADAVIDLQRSVKLRPDRRVQRELARAVLKTYEQQGKDLPVEFARVLENSPDHATFARTRIEDRIRRGRGAEAFRLLLEMAAGNSPSDDEAAEADIAANMVPLSHDWSQQRNLWIREQMAGVLASVGPDDERELNEQITARLDAALNDGSPDALKQFLRYFGQYRSSATARLALIDRLRKTDALLETEWNTLADSTAGGGGPQERAAAWHQAADLMTAFGRTAAATAYHWQATAEKSADAVAAGGSLPHRSVKPGEWNWPAGVVADGERQSSGAIRGHRIPFDGDPGPIFRDQILTVTPQVGITSSDRHGRQIWHLSFRDLAERGVVIQNHLIVRGRAVGNLLVLWFGRHVAAINTADVLAPSGATLLWTRTLQPDVIVPGRHTYLQVTQEKLPWGETRPLYRDMQGQEVHGIGPITADGLALLSSRGLMMVDPLTGETLWTRTGHSLNCELIGDHENLLVVPTQGEATVYEMRTGAEVKRCPVPPRKSRLLTIGSQAITWERSDARQTLQCRDLLTGQVMWSMPVADKSRACVVSADEVAVLQPDGQFDLRRIVDGTTLITAKLPAEKRCEAIRVHAWRDRRTLLVHRPAEKDDGNVTRADPFAGQGGLMFQGTVHGFQLGTPGKRWSTEADRHGLLLPQSTDAPLLVFATRLSSQGNNQRVFRGFGRWRFGGWGGGGYVQAANNTELLVLDVRNGQNVCQTVLASDLHAVSVTTRTDIDAVLVETGMSAVRLRFVNRSPGLSTD